MSLPTGTVTFLFTDIEGSTRLWEQFPDQMGQALARHDALLHDAIESSRGIVFKTVGDAFCAAFDSAPAAIAAAYRAQRALLTEDWPDSVAIKVRMAIHTGAVEVRDGDYFGPSLNRVARLLAIGHGGQVLLSEAVGNLAGNQLPDGAGLKDLGSHRLRDLHKPERVYQFIHDALRADFPPLRSLSVLPTNLQLQVTSFIGREKEIAEIKALLSRTRLLTLTGAGGCGKTRLALQVAADLLDDHPDGVWLAELAPLTDPALVTYTIASSLGLREEAERSPRQTLVNSLQSRNLLLIVDNCEHMLDATADLLNALLHACRDVKLLATSRQALNITGETVYRIPSLGLPAFDRPPTPIDLDQCESVRLFRERAQSYNPAFTITSANATAIAQICHRLDGIPLAIELAAARARAMPLEHIATRLDDRFRLLTGGSRTALPRQQTLRALIDWSYGLLSDQERILLRRLAVFHGSWLLVAAEQICADGDVQASGVGLPDTEHLNTCDIMDLLISLVDKSLVVFDTGSGDERYRMLETIRQYSLERLTQSGESDVVRERHLGYYVDLAERAEPQLRGPEQADWFSRLEAEHDNVRSALEWSLTEKARGRADSSFIPHPSLLCLRLAGAMWWFWMMRGYWSEGRARLERALSQPFPPADTDALASSKARALQGVGTIAYHQGEYTAARTHWEEALAIRRAQQDPRGIANILNNLGVISREQGDLAQARTCYEEALQLRRETGDTQGIAGTLNNLALFLGDLGELEAARSHYEEALVLQKQLGDLYAVATTLHNLGRLVYEKEDYDRARAYIQESMDIRREIGDKRGITMCGISLGSTAILQQRYTEARSLLEESLATSREIGDQWLMGFALDNTATLAVREGDPDRAKALYRESLRLRVQIGDRPGITHSLFYLAELAADGDDPLSAVYLWAASEALREALGISPAYPQQTLDEFRRQTEKIRLHLGEAEFSAAWIRGRGLTLEQAVQYAMTGRSLA